jgi:hypothetical protein
MNDTSSRSHCMAVFMLSVLDGDMVREKSDYCSSLI